MEPIPVCVVTSVMCLLVLPSSRLAQEEPTTASLSGTDGSPANNLLAAVFHDTVPGTSLADIVPPSPQGIANHAAKVAGTVPVQGPTPTNARPPPGMCTKTCFFFFFCYIFIISAKEDER
ncbi:uncharacterized protein LOC119639556 isoform X2 [Glossina fuscipes]|uniref:Uncharacterized protein LOC119639556 isoform X2 n=1 Tax=Glossina fuscipes TaxID=7396 RepID=A0A9C5ZAK8_9MUSC|nr:uncharacterized protein LOC119639556 isoform X2 [Glossina fuscipes]